MNFPIVIASQRADRAPASPDQAKAPPSQPQSSRAPKGIQEFIRNLPIALSVNLSLALGLALALFASHHTGISSIAMVTILVANALGLLLAASRRRPWFNQRGRPDPSTRDLLAAQRALKLRAEALEAVAWDRTQEIRDTNHLLQQEMGARRREQHLTDQAVANHHALRLELLAIASQLQGTTAPDSPALPHLSQLQATLQRYPGPLEPGAAATGPGPGRAAAAALAAEPALATAPAAAAPGPVAPRKVLVVDDEPAILETVATMLEHLGLKVVTARDGSEAMACFAAQADQLSLVLLDLAMPRMDGQQTFLAIRSQAANLPIIIASGHDARHRLRLVEGPGCPTFLQKPFSLARLQETVELALATKVAAATH